jgi:hypothetical protein
MIKIPFCECRLPRFVYGIVTFDRINEILFGTNMVNVVMLVQVKNY